MPDTLLRKESYGQLVRGTGSVVATAGHRMKDGITSNRNEMLILLGTVLFVVAMTMLGAFLISVG
jgi:hypothetical protein